MLPLCVCLFRVVNVTIEGLTPPRLSHFRRIFRLHLIFPHHADLTRVRYPTGKFIHEYTFPKIPLNPSNNVKNWLQQNHRSGGASTHSSQKGIGEEIDPRYTEL